MPVTGTHELPVFVIASLLLAMTPGPDTAYIVGRSAQHGWSGGWVAACGIALGIWVHILAAAVGLSALLVASASAFVVAKLAGAAYLVYLGFKMILHRVKSVGPNTSPRDGSREASTSQIFWRGFLTNVLNPKVGLFFLAFLPQFIDANAQSKAAAFLFLGLVFDVVGTMWNLVVAGAAAQVVGWTKRSTQLLSWVDRTIGAVFIYLGIRLAAADQR